MLASEHGILPPQAFRLYKYIIYHSQHALLIAACTAGVFFKINQRRIFYIDLIYEQDVEHPLSALRILQRFMILH